MEVVEGRVVDSPDFDTEQLATEGAEGAEVEEGGASFAVTASLEFPESAQLADVVGWGGSGSLLFSFLLLWGGCGGRGMGMLMVDHQWPFNGS